MGGLFLMKWPGETRQYFPYCIQSMSLLKENSRNGKGGGFPIEKYGKFWSVSLGHSSSIISKTTLWGEWWDTYLFCIISAIEESQSTITSRKSSSNNLPKPEIKHEFREPERRPSTAVSTVFTILCLLPLFVCLMIWMRLGVNITSIPFSIACIGK